MVLISYDISNDKKRSRFSRYLSKFGHRIQYSLYRIDNSERILSNIVTDINNKFLKQFDESDSVYIIKLSNTSEIQKFGYASHEDDSMLIV